MKKILLLGNPNVGKSVVFSKLTGTSVVSSNYAGTTVEFTKGHMKWRDEVVEIIDVPGTYTLEPTNKAEEVAVEMLDEGDLIINVVDSTNLERNLNLTLQLLEKNIPMIISLNFWDETEHKGINIDVEKLEEYFKVPVIPTSATKGIGLKDIIRRFDYDEVVEHSYGDNESRWSEIGRIIKDVQNINYKQHSFSDLMEDLTLKPLTGIPIAVIVLFVSFMIIRFVGEGFIGYIAEPFFEILYRPIIVQLSTILGGGGFIHNLIVGELIEGSIDFEQSFGLLTTGIYIPLAAVLPYIISFYFVLGLLEDIGYLPRISVLVDNIMHRVGLHGFSIIPLILAFGCNVPAALAIRNLESKREKFIASTLMATTIPCISQMAMVVGLLGSFGGKYLLYLFAVLVVLWIFIGTLMNKLVPGFSTDLLLELPSFRFPSISTVFKKLWMRILGFLKEALPMVLLGVFIINIFYTLGIFDFLTAAIGPVLKNVFGVPEAAIEALIMGFLRKDLAMGVLLPLGLTAKQMLTMSILLVIYFPCIATFVILLRELGPKDMLKATAIMLTSTVVVGGYINFSFGADGFDLIRLVPVVILFILIHFIPKNKKEEIGEN
jgi:ferrous iron transport protein B